MAKNVKVTETDPPMPTEEEITKITERDLAELERFREVQARFKKVEAKGAAVLSGQPERWEVDQFEASFRRAASALDLEAENFRRTGERLIQFFRDHTEREK